MAETAQAEGGVDQAFVEGFLSRWDAAWNSHEPERVVELMTQDIVYDDSGWPTTMRGHGDVRAYLSSLWRGFPDMAFAMTEGPLLQPGAPKAAFLWRGSATHTGPLDPPGFAPTGKRIEFEGADFLEFREGRVCRLRVVFDMMDVARQLGTLPRAGSRAEKAVATAQRLSVQARSRLRRRQG
jgi:steroid delta-isomerase-like uncharacterized protein